MDEIEQCVNHASEMASDVHLELSNVKSEVEFTSQKLIGHIIDNRAELTALKSEAFWLRHLVIAQHKRLFGHNGYGKKSAQSTEEAREMAREMVTTMSRSEIAKEKGDADTELIGSAYHGASPNIRRHGFVEGDGEHAEEFTMEATKFDTETMVEGEVLKEGDA